jgi:arabinose-5-phosphate isomerase
MNIGQHLLRPELADNQTTDDLAVARDVLATEAAGITALSAALDQRFALAVDLLAGVTGRIVVSGMGKSGHVARKIAATLASTGSPAMFVHPAEASHGDLGMIVPGDAVLALSNSGETAELADLVSHATRFAVPLISITAAAGSALALASKVALVLPAAPEAGPIGLAPTTSTTMQMALGDALAIALLARRGFTAHDFREFHPGGKLGARLRHVRDLMHSGTELPLVPPDMRMDKALIAMTAKPFGCLGIIDPQRRLLGVFTDGDLRRSIGPDLFTQTIDRVMTRSPKTIAPEALAGEALLEMNSASRPFTAIFVVDDAGVVIGILHIHDLLRAGIA